RPISFRMDLYRPLYVQRPIVELDLFAGLMPRAHDGSMDWLSRQRNVHEGKKSADNAFAPSPRNPKLPVKPLQVGDFFQYVLDHPVSLPRQKSALFPILQQEIAGTRVSIYNEKTLAKHPFLGLRFKNTTGLHLMQGPLTIFEGGSYAGDARIRDLQPKEER